MLIAAAAILLLIGIVLTSVGVRGRVVSQNPHCAACGFDLIGTDLASPSALCSECGTALSVPGAVLRGARQRRPAFLGVGLLLLVLSLSITGVAIYGGVKGINWNTLKPAWLLMRELQTSNQTVSTAAMKELESRLAAGTLGADRAAKIMELALARQADPNAVWFVAWGNYLESCRGRGLMSPEQVQAYARHAPLISIEARPKISEGSNLQIRARVGGGRIGEKSNLSITLKSIDTSEGGRVIGTGGGGGSMGLGTQGWGSMGSSVVVKGPPGAHTLVSRWKFGVVEGGLEGTPIVTWEESFEVPVQVLPAGSVDVEVVEDESLRPAIQAAFSATQCEVYSNGSLGLEANGMINSTGTSIGLAYDVFWRATDGSAEWKLGSVNFNAGSGSSGYGYGGRLPKDFNQTQVDVVLRPSIRAATETTGIFKIWGGELVLPKVPVKLPKPVETPQSASPGG